MARVSFTEHPASVGESYVEHARMAGSFGVVMLLGGLACLVHAIFPFLFVTTGSGMIATLYRRMVTHRTAGESRAVAERAVPAAAE